MESARLKGIIIMGSARSDGNTRAVVDAFVSHTGFSIADLNDHQIGFFEYDMPDRQDDFIPLIEELLQYDLLVFATPVYWYSMSAVMKNFFDRITDLLKWHKDLGRQLRTKSMAMISCGTNDTIGENFAVPFVNTAEYLGMEYYGSIHTWADNGTISESVQKRISSFAGELR